MKSAPTAVIRIWLRRSLPLTVSTLLVLGLISEPWPASAQDPLPTRRVNAPYFNGDVLSNQAAVFWLGQVDDISNYADVRLGYNDDEIELTVHIIDRRLWYDTSPTPADLTVWDAVTLYLHLDGNTGNSLAANSHRFVAQLKWWEDRADYQAAYRWDGSGWVTAPTPFTTTSSWRGNAPIDDEDDRGWWVQFHIPFASLELAGPPPSSSVWGLALILHDRDDAAGTPIPDQTWPETVDEQRPATWGQLVFGLPDYTPPAAAPGELVTIRHGLDGNAVVDAHVGGHGNCGAGLWPDIFNNWGEANYAGYDQLNIQNQWDIADWPCFSKYYVTFPLDVLPAGKSIISATLTMHLFGNAGYQPGNAQPSFIQALTVAEDWQEPTLTWNSAPLARENVAATWVNPVDFYAEWPGVPYTWDVSRAVAEAYAEGDPLRLALYSADGEYHSGKYFWSSDAGELARPALQVLWGDAMFDLTASPSLQQVETGGVATYTLQVQHGAQFTPTVSLQVGASPSPDLLLSLASPTSFSPPGGQTTLTLQDLHDPPFSAALWYTIPITASGGGITQTIDVRLLVNAEQVFLPVLLRSAGN